MYYGIVMIAVVLFGFQFFFNQKYERECGNTVIATLAFILTNSLFGIIILLTINGFRIEYTLFSLIVAMFASTNGLLCGLCSLKALGKTNLSLFSLFSMLGGMILPFLAGLIFFDEKLTSGKVISIFTVIIALILTLKQDKSTRGGMIYCAGVFVFNGMNGVISKFFQASEYDKTSAAGYSILISIVTILICGITLLIMRPKIFKFTRRAVVLSAGYGILNKVGNYLLLITLIHLPASAQYPLVTGGVIIISTLLSYFTEEKPSNKELISVAVSFIGILFLVLL